MKNNYSKEYMTYKEKQDIQNHSYIYSNIASDMHICFMGNTSSAKLYRFIYYE